MHIAFVSQPFDLVLPPHQNSLGLWIYNVARRLSCEHRVTVYLTRPSDVEVPAGDGLTYSFARLMPPLPLRVINRAWRVIESPRRPAFAMLHNFLEYIVQIGFDLRRERPDVVHILNYSQFVPVIRRLYPQARIALHMQCEWLSQLDRAMIGARLRETDLVIGTSEYITDKVRRRFPEYARRCVTVYNGVDVERFAGQRGQPDQQPTTARHLLFVGRVSPEKGVHTLIEAFRIVAERFPDVYLNIVGPDWPAAREYIVGLSDEPYIQRLARFYDGRSYEAHLRERIPASLVNRVIFHGAHPQAETVAFYRKASILLNASLSESFGMSVVEAGAMGIPAIVSRIGGMQETVVDGVSGLIVEPEDPEGLARAITSLLVNDELRRAMGEAAHDRAVRLFSWDLVAESLLTKYQQGLTLRAA